MTITAPADPVSCLSLPRNGPDNFLHDTVVELQGWMRPVDWVLSEVISWSPIEEWIVKPLGGDWGAMQLAADAWTGVGKAIAATAENLESIPAQLVGRWEGQAASAFMQQNQAVAERLADYPDVCFSIAEFLENLIRLMKAALAVIVNTINLLIEHLKNLSHLVSGADDICGRIDDIRNLRNRIATWSQDAADAANTVLEAVNNFLAFLRNLEGEADDVGDLLKRIRDRVLGVLGRGSSGPESSPGGGAGRSVGAR
ncbi:hypothetical protein GCM10022198_14730 [Klugiella xanthotipulae]|uniref:PPE family protein n=1 Tax=Klugiella xanthotipulae TaxID=244735 RepID=A0A543I6Q3_9MICO|nr:PPE domain-containing protein [Klugiella xanthotipulae]TQM66235.1 PPE family protein [Klugiella xanthotipulae]